MSIDLKNLEQRKIICPPKWLTDNVHYLVIMGSHAYGCETPESDYDIYGWCIPPKNILFPWNNGLIFGFDNFNSFDQWQEQHINDGNGKELDFSIYNITRYFFLCANANPNMIETLYAPQNCILKNSSIGQMVREKRHLFLSKKAWHSYKGYSYSQLGSMTGRNYTGKRVKIVEKFGFDTKAATNVVRLLYQIEQILTEEDLDLQKHKEYLKAIRRGEVSENKIKEFFNVKEKEFEKLYHQSKLPYSPRFDEIRQLLIDCLEHHYGSLENMIKIEKDQSESALAFTEIKEIVDKYRNRI